MAVDSITLKKIEAQIDLYSLDKSYIKKSAEFIDKNEVFILKTSDIKRASLSNQMPDILFAQGDEKVLSKFRIGIVGTRKPDEYGVRVVTDIIRRYRNKDIATVSGFAEGIDSLVHSASIENGIPTIAVLPCGFANNYPASNKDLRARIRKNGLLATEYSPYVKGLQLNFIQRNHIIAAISDILIITQGAMQSGTLSTLTQALKLKKQIFALPGEITNKLSYAPNYAIFRGAAPIYSKDVLPGISSRMRVATKLTEDEEAVLELVKKFRNVNDVLSSKEMPYEIIAASLTSLEMKGVVMKGFNNKISVVED
ncbi:MAG: DNA-processing protein DprA [bacterium]|nr:DNA-processing protein DprA [bacterium]